MRTADGKERIVEAREKFPDLQLGNNHIVPAAKVASDYSDDGEIKCENFLLLSEIHWNCLLPIPALYSIVSPHSDQVSQSNKRSAFSVLPIE